MRADNKGEGGIMALTALALRTANASPRVLWMLSALGIFGAALFYGDAVITPAMSVLAAVEGLEVVAPQLEAYVLPITVAILVLLFVFQRHGTAAVGALFGPLMLFWFATLGALGLWNVIQHLVLPATTLGILFLAQYARISRTAMIEVLGADYIRTARAKGLGEGRVTFHHALRNAVLPIMTIAGLQFGNLI